MMFSLYYSADINYNLMGKNFQNFYNDYSHSNHNSKLHIIIYYYFKVPNWYIIILDFVYSGFLIIIIVFKQDFLIKYYKLII